ncbi:MAG: hypothetical protein PHR11_02445 [Candidatus Omnitrophica bacterium]|nr:hypothetical protein [Candidatus Omnitrophota bacterium]
MKKLPRRTLQLISTAQDTAAALGAGAYLVGGFVRDVILGVGNFDLDIVVEADGILFAQEFARRTSGSIVSHTRFGTASVALEGGLKVDIATARKETYPVPACLPQVSRGTLRDDLARRDFTINAMAASISAGDFGLLVDFFGGAEDLRRGKIRVLHPLSFRDDPTRILRAIRFEKRYGFTIEPLSLRLLKQAVAQGLIQRVGPHRLRDELVLNLKEKRVLEQLKRIRELTGFGFIHPRAAFPPAAQALAVSCQRELSWFKRKFPRHRGVDSWLVYLACLLEELNNDEVRETCRRFALRGGDEKRILSYKKAGGSLIRRLAQKSLRPSEIFGCLEPLSYEAIILLRARTKDARVRKRTEDFFEIYNGMKLYISGDDLRRLGIAPGPYYRKIFSEVLAAKLNGEVRTPQEELALIKKIREAL